eukprot:6205611-Pleurochrysis_carterae.AAC.1
MVDLSAAVALAKSKALAAKMAAQSRAIADAMKIETQGGAQAVQQRQDALPTSGGTTSVSPEEVCSKLA